MNNQKNKKLKSIKKPSNALKSLSNDFIKSITDINKKLPQILKLLNSPEFSENNSLNRELETLQKILSDSPRIQAKKTDKVVDFPSYTQLQNIINHVQHLFAHHPWHADPINKELAPEIVTAFIEITPTDTHKYEVHKPSGIIRVDRPQILSSICPNCYGFIPQTFCGKAVAEYCQRKTGRKGIVGDGDPLDICVFMSNNIAHGGVALEVIPIGGFRMIDGNEADDKIIAVLKGDLEFGDKESLKDLNAAIVTKLKHYFLTYKDLPDTNTSGKNKKRVCEITHTYSKLEALDIIRASQKDYLDKFGLKYSLS